MRYIFANIYALDINTLVCTGTTIAVFYIFKIRQPSTNHISFVLFDNTVATLAASTIEAALRNTSYRVAR